MLTDKTIWRGKRSAFHGRSADISAIDRRFCQLVLSFGAIIAWIVLSAMFVHELGHAVAAWATGGEIVSLELRPGRLSHTLVQPNPHPSVVLWGGFLGGWLTPLLTAPVWRIEAGLIGPVLRAWAAFCWLAGGVYLAIGFGERFADTGQLVIHGWPIPLLVAIGVGVAGLGYWQSRNAWIAIAKRIESKPITWRLAGGWAAWLTGWWGVQFAIARLLEP